MSKSIKNFVVSAFKAGKDRDYIRKILFGKVSDIEVVRALKLFDSLSLKKDKNSGNFLTNSSKVFFYAIRILWSWIVYIFLKISFNIKKFIFGHSEEIHFNEIKDSFSIKGYFSKTKKRLNSQSPHLIKRLFFVIFIVIIFGFIIIFSTFYFSKVCENQTCFKEMVSKCQRAEFISKDLVGLENKILGPSLGGCKIIVTSLENDIGLKSGEKMTCYMPLGIKVMPQTKLEFCSGKLREDIQEILISELYKTIGQNLPELNSFFKRG
jgi:hypothetical protein